MATVVAIATVALVGITAWYATETRRTVRELRKAREEEVGRARFERSREHAIAVREALRYVTYGKDVYEITRDVRVGAV
jgi:hypothetical protein